MIAYRPNPATIPRIQRSLAAPAAGWRRERSGRCRAGCLGARPARQGRLLHSRSGRMAAADPRHQWQSAYARSDGASIKVPAVTVELILDGVHLHPAIYGQVSRWVGDDRIALVSDAMTRPACPTVSTP